MNSIGTMQSGRRVRPGHESLGSLLRRPIVQLILVGAAGAQVVTVQTAGIDSENSVFRVRKPTFEMAAVHVSPDSAALAARADEEVLEQSQELAEEYRTRGFGVTATLAAQIGEAAAEFDIDPQVAFGLVRAESSFRNQATSQVGAVGLTQLMPGTARWIEPGVTRSELRDPETNLRVGFKYLRYLIDKYEGDERLALLAYNRGPGTVDNALRRGRNPDNGYADFVFGKADHGHRLFTAR